MCMPTLARPQVVAHVLSFFQPGIEAWCENPGIGTYRINITKNGGDSSNKDPMAFQISNPQVILRLKVFVPFHFPTGDT